MRIRLPLGVGRSYEIVRAEELATPPGRTKRKDKDKENMQESGQRGFDVGSWAEGGEVAIALVEILKEIKNGSFQNVSLSFWNGVPQMSFWRKREGRLVLLDSFQFKDLTDFLYEIELRFPVGLQ